VRRTLELHWPAFLVASTCAGIGLSVWLALSLVTAAAVALLGLLTVLSLDGPARVAALALVLAALGMGWGSLRMDALDASCWRSESAGRARPPW